MQPPPPPPTAAHASAVAASLASQLSALRHWNGAPVCTLYGAHQQRNRQQLDAGPGAAAAAAAVSPLPSPRAVGVCGQGAVVAFNLLRSDGSFVGYRCGCLHIHACLLCSVAGALLLFAPSHHTSIAAHPLGPRRSLVASMLLSRSSRKHAAPSCLRPPAPGPFFANISPLPCCCREVEKLASLSSILLRTGCMCNPGACAAALGLTAAGGAQQQLQPEVLATRGAVVARTSTFPSSSHHAS
jgi:hypothetical protein